MLEFVTLRSEFCDTYFCVCDTHFRDLGGRKRKVQSLGIIIQIDTLARYGCILLIVSVQSSLNIEKQIPVQKASKKSVTHTRF